MKVELLALCLAGAVVAVALFPIVASALAGFARVVLVDAAFGMGPKLVEKKLGATRWTLRLLPLNSWVKAAGQGVYDDEEVERAALRPGRVLWREASPARRVLAFVVAPRVVVLVLAAVVLGPTGAVFATGRVIVQLVTGALGPLSTAREILEGGAALLAREGALVIVALVSCKWLGFSVLTLPGDLAGATDTELAASKKIAIARAVLMVVFLGLVVSWIVAWIAFLAR